MFLRILAVSLAAALAAAPASAAPDPLRLTDALVLPTPAGAPAASAHLTVRNVGRTDDQLISVSSPDAARVEIHRMDMAGGVMRMRPVLGGLAVPAGGVLELSPRAGLHLMLIAPKRRLSLGERTTLALVFAHAGRRVVEAPVGAPRP